ncbi:MAG: class I SAM-dependent methyltransferase [Betaproteobacteria bacterium]|nr:MAG: class I SAM-dependent methyltransferase [Betaproteobacteria bacterium]
MLRRRRQLRAAAISGTIPHAPARRDQAQGSTDVNGSAGLRNLLVALACAAGLAAPAAAQAPHTHQHSFDDAQQWARVFDDPERDAWQKPHEVIGALALKPDAVVADIGAGTGYFSVRLAHMAPKGRIYGVDTEPGMVKHLAERAKRANLANVSALLGAPDDPRLPEKVDLILLVDVYHHIEDRGRYFRRLQNALKPGARIAIIDFRRDSPVGPPAAARIAPQTVRAELASAGFELSQEHGFLPNQYFLVFRAAGS